MNLAGKSLTEVAAAVSTQLATFGIDCTVVGGSAVTAYAPDIYTSQDVDFVTSQGGRRLTEALREIGFSPQGRIYVNASTPYTVDIVGSTPMVEDRVIIDFDVIHTDLGDVRVMSLEDVISDRLAAFVHWSDNQALDVAERVVRAIPKRVDSHKLAEAISALSPPDAPSQARFDLARARIERALRESIED